MTLEEDRDLLIAVLETDLDERTESVFDDMLCRLDRFCRPLTPRQRAWAAATLRGDRYVPEEEYENLVSSGKVKRGKEVPTIALLDPSNLPKKPPGRR